MTYHFENPVPVITIDGTSGSGKGTLSRLLAHHLGWHLLDSGVLYRLLALAVQKQGIDLEDEVALIVVGQNMGIVFPGGEAERSGKVLLEGEDVSEQIRDEECAKIASQIASLPMVRQILLERQRAFRLAPGLVADGRDMGTVVFPDAKVKFFFDASQEVRAQRRYKQLKEQGIDVNLRDVFKAVMERDQRDCARAVAPLQPAVDAIRVDTDQRTIEEVLQFMLQKCLSCL